MFEKNINLIDIQTIAVSLIILGVCLLRIIPHINNFSPIIALAIFSSLHFKNPKYSYVVTILSLWVSDFVINNFVYNLTTDMFWFYEGFYWQYLSYIIIIFLSSLNINKKICFRNTIFLAFSSSFIFFLVTNFGFWVATDFYSYDTLGLIECYVAAIPFFKGTLFGTLFYTPIFFGAYYMLQKKFSYLRNKNLSY